MERSANAEGVIDRFLAGPYPATNRPKNVAGTA